MATTRNLILTFQDNEGDDFSQTWRNCDSEAEAASVKALMQGCIANGAIFARQPALMKSAKITTKTDTPININD